MVRNQENMHSSTTEKNPQTMGKEKKQKQKNTTRKKNQNQHSF